MKKTFLSLFFVLIFFSSSSDAEAVTLSWNTFLGGSSTDQIRDVAVDSSGNIYTTGYSDATWGSPIRAYSSSHDVFVAKINSSGTVVWNTFLGTTGADVAYDLAISSDGSIFVTGYSNGTWGSPIRAFTTAEDGFIAKLDADGNLVWNTFLGGSGIQDEGFGVMLDTDGNIYVAGITNATWESPIRPFTSSVMDGFVAKLDSTGNLIWNTFLGGSGNDYGISVELDGSNDVVVGGYSNATWGSPVRSYTASDDVFLAKFDNDPIISSVASVTSKTGSTITWTTNESSSTKVDYGISSYNSSTSETDTGSGRVTSHSVSISGLADCTKYQYRVRSIDSASNETVSGDGSFSTMCAPSSPLCSDTAPSGRAPVILSATSLGEGGGRNKICKLAKSRKQFFFGVRS